MVQVRKEPKFLIKTIMVSSGYFDINLLSSAGYVLDISIRGQVKILWPYPFGLWSIRVSLFIIVLSYGVSLFNMVSESNRLRFAPQKSRSLYLPHSTFCLFFKTLVQFSINSISNHIYFYINFLKSLNSLSVSISYPLICSLLTLSKNSCSDILNHD